MKRLHTYIPWILLGALVGGFLFFALFGLVGPDARGPFERFPWNLAFYAVVFLIVPAFPLGSLAAYMFHGSCQDYSIDAILVLHAFYACLFGYLLSSKKGWKKSLLILLALHVVLVILSYATASVFPESDRPFFL